MAGNTNAYDSSNNLLVSVAANTATNQSTNIAQVAGATVATGAGTAAGALRVELPTDGTGKVSANLSQVAGATVQTGSGVAAGSQRVEIANNGTGVVGLNAGTAHIGEASCPTAFVDTTMTCDTGILASGDIITTTTTVTSATRANDTFATLTSMTIIDEDDQGAAFDIYFFSANVSLGTNNNAPNISDANAREVLGVVSVLTTDYKDLGGVKIASYKNIQMIVKPATGTRNIFVSIVNGAGTPTYTVNGLRLRLGFTDQS